MKLPETGVVRLAEFLPLLPISRSTWWAGVKTGRYPKAIHYAEKNITVWKVEDIRVVVKATIAELKEKLTLLESA